MKLREAPQQTVCWMTLNITDGLKLRRISVESTRENRILVNCLVANRLPKVLGWMPGLRRRMKYSRCRTRRYVRRTRRPLLVAFRRTKLRERRAKKLGHRV